MRGALSFAPPCVESASRTAEVFLLPHRAVYWPCARSLLVADLHWGKCETFRAAGAPLPQGLLQSDLQRLDAALRSTESERLVVIGDLLHASMGITEWLVDCIHAWRAQHRTLEILVVPGNHDRRIGTVADAWGLTLASSSHEEGPFVFTHDPGDIPPEAVGFAWAGHIHPMITLRGRGDAIRVPAFHMTPGAGILPAFSSFTDGISVVPTAGDSVFAIGPEGVFRVR
jgi:DNA ligase-associated metallophosphoesterase